MEKTATVEEKSPVEATTAAMPKPATSRMELSAMMRTTVVAAVANSRRQTLSAGLAAANATSRRSAAAVRARVRQMIIRMTVTNAVIPAALPAPAVNAPAVISNAER